MTMLRADAYRLVEGLGYLLRRAHKLSLADAERAFEGEELNLTQWLALIALRDGLIDTPGSLARALDHDSGATTRMVDHLEERGLLTRQRSATDRRVVHLSLTQKGAAAADRLVPRIISLWNEILDGFEPDEVEMLVVLLRRLIRRFEARMTGIRPL